MADGQVFRIEIPIEVTSKTDTSKLKQVETTIQKTESALKKILSTGDSAFQKIASGASSAASSLQKVDSAAEKTSDAIDKAGDSADDMGDSVEEVGAAAKSAGNSAKQAFEGAGQSADKFSQRMERSQKTLRQMFKEKAKLVLEAIDKISPILQKVTTSVKSLAAKAWRVTVKMLDLVTAPFRALKNMIMSPITMTLSIAGIGLGASSFYETFSSFTAGMSNVKALSGATDLEFKELTATAKELGATTKFTAAEASEGMQYLAMAGWETSEIIEAMPGLLQLAAAGATDLGTASDIVSDVMTAMGMSANEATRAADVFARTATSTNTTVSMMGEALKYAAPAAKAFGMEIEDVATLTGMMANAGIKGSSAGTALRTALIRMASPTAETAKAMKQLGVTFDDGHGNMKDMKTIMTDLSAAFKNLGNQERLAAADDLFGKNASTAWLAVLDQGIDKYNELNESIYASNGAAQEMADIQLDNLAGDVTLLQSAVDGMKITLMDKISPYLRQGVQWITSKIPEITQMLSGFVDKAVAKAKELKDFIGGIFNSAEMQNADSFADKLFIAWDKIIAEPFNAWWEGSGRDFVLGIVKKIGSGFGEALHGIVAGVFAAIKGEEIDFEGMNLTGIAKAGAEAAKEYISAFTKGLNAGDLLGAVPGGLKAGLIGFGALKVGGGAIGIAKTVGQLKLAFSGVKMAAASAAPAMAVAGEAAATAGASAAGGASAFGAIGSALAAIPGWGWAALAVLTAVGVGLKLHHDNQEKQKQDLLHAGDAVEAASERYVAAAERANDMSATITGIQEIQLKLTTDQSANEETIAMVQGEIDGILNQYITLQAQLANEFLTDEEKAKIQTEIDKIDSNVELKATLDAAGYNTLEAGIIISQFNSLKEAEKEIALTFTEHTDMSPEDVAALTQNLSELMGIKTELELKISGYQMSQSRITTLQGKANDLKTKMADIEIKVAAGTATEQEIAKYEGYKEELAIIEMQLQGKEMSEDEYNAIVGQVNDINAVVGDCVLKIAEDPNSDFSQSDIDHLLEQLSTAGDFSWKLGINLKTGSITTDDLEAYNQQLEAYAKHLEEISGGMIKTEDVLNGTVTDEQYEDAKKYSRLTEEQAYHELGAEVFSGRGNLADEVQTRKEYKDALDASTSASENLGEAQRQAMMLQQEVRTFWAENSEMEAAVKSESMSEEAYLEWYDKNAAKYTGEGLLAQWNERVAPNLVGTDVTLNANAIQGTEGGLVDQALDATMAAILDSLAGAEKRQMEAQYLYDTQNEALVKQYRGERDYMTGGYTLGTEYAGMNIEELAANYANLDEIGKQAFESAYLGLQKLNEEVDYISDEEKTQEADIMQAAYDSAEKQAKQQLIDEAKAAIQKLEDTYGNDVFAGTEQQAAAIQKVNDALKSLGSEVQIESFDQVEAALNALTDVNVDEIDFSTAAKSVENMGGKASDARRKLDEVKTAMEQLDGKTANITLNINQKGSTEVTVPGQSAEGGIFDGAFLSWVAEDGPEAIIPLGRNRRNRGLDLWMQAGKALGVNEFAEGGIMAPYSGMIASLPEDYWNDDGGGSGDFKPAMPVDGSGSVIEVNVDVNPEYRIEGGGDAGSVIDAIRAHQNELAELLGAAMADQLEDIISNM